MPKIGVLKLCDLSVYRIIKARLILVSSGMTSAFKRKKTQANISKFFQCQDQDAVPVCPVSTEVHDDAEVPPVTDAAGCNELTGPRPPVDKKTLMMTGRLAGL